MGLTKVNAFVRILTITTALCSTPSVWGKDPPNAGGYFCKGCGVVMEHTFHGLVKKMEKMQRGITAGVEKQVKIKIQEEIIEPLCEKPFFQTYTEEIKDACKQIVSKNPHIVDASFKNFRHDYTDLYKRTKKVCVDDMNLCSGDAPDIEL